MAVEDESDPRFADKIFWTPEPSRRIGRARDRALRTVARVRSPLFWRSLYWVLSRRSFVRSIATVLASLDAVSPGRARALLARLQVVVVDSGWPRRSFGAINLDVARLQDHVEYQLVTTRWPVVARRLGRRAAQRPRVGLLGRFLPLLTFSLEHIDALAAVAEVSVFDLDFNGRHASYLRAVRGEYRPLALWGPPAPRSSRPPEEALALAAAINEADLDLLVLINARFALTILDLVETPCIVSVPTGSRPLFHRRIDRQIYVQPLADYFMRGNELFCGMSRSPMRERGIVHGYLLYDLRDLQSEEPLPWDERKPLIVCHGSLYKAASRPYLDCLFGLLQDDPALELKLVGKDDGSSWSLIEHQAAAAGLSSRVSWDGAYARFRGEDGVTIADDGWRRLVELLRSARLAPDPWPFGGGSSRVEAYALGVPAPHMALRTDPASWGMPQEAVVEPDVLHVERAASLAPRQYADVCRRLLYERDLAEAVIADQRAIASTVTDPVRYWDQVLRLYREWAGLT